MRQTRPIRRRKRAPTISSRAWRHTYGLPVVITNCSNNYGPCHFPEKLIPLMILNALEGKPLPVYGTGENVRDWLYVEDHAEALLLVARQGVLGESYNIGGRSERRNIDVVEAICDLVDELAPCRRRPEAARIDRFRRRTVRVTICATRSTAPRSSVNSVGGPRDIRDRPAQDCGVVPCEPILVGGDPLGRVPRRAARRRRLISSRAQVRQERLFDVLVENTAIPDVKIITPKKFGDHRGFFSETYNRRAVGGSRHSIGIRPGQSFAIGDAATIRGLHFQIRAFRAG